MKTKLLTLFCCGGLLCLFLDTFAQTQSSVASKNIFAPYLKDQPPKIVETISKVEKDGIETTKFKYVGHSGSTKFDHETAKKPKRPL